LTQIKQGKTYLYKPAQDQSQTLKSLVKQTLDSFMDRFGDAAIAAFLDEASTKHTSKTKK
jgi:predicted transcriptional regulator